MEHVNAMNRAIDRLEKARALNAHEEVKRHIDIALLYLRDIKRNIATAIMKEALS